MAVDGLLMAIQEKAATRGMTLAALARASGMQPSNLRRMLKSPTASPHLGSVMRLLAPLRCHIGPAGATEPGELAAFLDGLRQSRGIAWDQLLEAGGVHGAKLAATMTSNPERLPLDLVMRLADALEVTLMLVDAKTTVTAPVGVSAPRRPRARASTRDTQPVMHSQRASPEISIPPPSPSPSPSPGDPPSRIPPPTACPPRSDPSPSPTSAGPSLPPLRPPRLGRYRDVPPEPVQPRPLPATWTPSTRTHAVEVALFERIADFSLDDLHESYTLARDSFAHLKSIPLSVLAGIASLFRAGFSRRRRPPPGPEPEPTAGCFDELDAAPFWRYWKASKLPGYRETESNIGYDSLGMLATHVALDQGWAVAIRLKARGQPHRLVAVLNKPHRGEVEVYSRPDSPLAINIGGDMHAFRHIRSGPIFGELEVRGRVYLLAAVSALLVLIEGSGEFARVVWGGKPEGLKEVVVEMDSSADIIEVESASSAEPSAALVELRDRLATALSRCEELDAARRTAEAERTAAVTARRSVEDDLAAERSARRVAEAELVAEREARQTAADALVAARTALDQEGETRCVMERLAAETMGKLMALVAQRTQELAAESERRAAAEAHAVEAETRAAEAGARAAEAEARAAEAEARAAEAEARALEAEQARDAMAAENVEALRMFEEYTKEVDERHRAMEAQLTKIDGLESQVAATRALIPTVQLSSTSPDRPATSRAKGLSKKWRR